MGHLRPRGKHLGGDGGGDGEGEGSGGDEWGVEGGEGEGVAWGWCGDVNREESMRWQEMGGGERRGSDGEGEDR